MFCNKCGAQLPDGANFCSSCGNQFQNQGFVSQPQLNPQTTFNPQFNSSAQTRVLTSPNPDLIVCNSPEPIEQENKMLNLLLIIPLLGLWIRTEIYKTKSYKLRLKKFYLPFQLPLEELAAEMRVMMAPYGENKIVVGETRRGSREMQIEFEGVMYNVQYNADGSFSLIWGLSLGKALITERRLALYRKLVLGMGIIAFNIQQISARYI